MTVPGFAAEASLYATGERYHSASESTSEILDSVLTQQLCRHLDRVEIQGHKFHPGSACGVRRRRGEFDAIAKTTEFANHLSSSTMSARFRNGRAAFFIGNAIVQDLPDEPTEAMGDRSDCVGMA